MNNEIKQKLKDCFVQESRLLSRLVVFINEYVNFEHDELGMNMDEQELIFQRAYKIVQKISTHIYEKSALLLEVHSILPYENKVEFVLKNTKQQSQHETQEELFGIIVDDESFTLETYETKPQSNDEENVTFQEEKNELQ